MKRLILALAVIGAPALAQDDVGRQIAASAASAQTLQGSLDGTWTLAGRGGVTLYTLAIGDPPTHSALGCAWRDPAGARGYADCRRRGGRLEVRLATGVSLRLERDGPRIWRGTMVRGGRAESVTLRRS